MISDLITIEYARNAILVFFLSGCLLAYLSGYIRNNERLAAGLFVGQTGALGLLIGSVSGFMLPVTSSATAMLGVASVLLISQVRVSTKSDASRQSLFQIGFFLAATLCLVIISKTTFDQPRFEELMFGRIFTVSNPEIVLLVGVAIIASLLSFARKKFGAAKAHTFFLLAFCSGPIIPILGVLPFAALILLLPDYSEQARSSFKNQMLIIGAHVTVSSVMGIYIALQYGLPGAPTVTAFIALFAFVRFVTSTLKPGPEA